VETHATIQRFTISQRVQHLLMLVCFFGLVLTGFPQKYSSTDWAKGVSLIFGGVERMRWLHHLFGTVMALQLVWHALELAWNHFACRRPLTMLPSMQDARDFFQQVGYNVGLVRSEPRMGRFTFAEKLEYLALVWGTILMVATGLILLYPIHFSGIFPGEAIPAAKAAHGGEALLAILAVITWHFYFVHFRHWNPSIFTGRLPHHIYQEEHPLELERMHRGARPAGVRPTWLRLVVFAAFAAVLLVLVGVILDWLWAGPSVGLGVG
jgi:cytochrome b subunit of formate dehydrogenase